MEECCGREFSDALCSDGIDNDGNGVTDCGDFYCRYGLFVSVCTGSAETACADGKDNDGDKLIDCKDPDCMPVAACKKPVATAAKEDTLALCSDGGDNDGNGFQDCYDFACSRADHGASPDAVAYCASVSEASYERCADGIDTDKNGYTDCADYSCSKSAEPWPANDGMTVADFCFAKGENTFEKCTDHLDNDANGYADCQDYGCFGAKDAAVAQACQESLPDDAVGANAKCSDGKDNDKDGYTDCDDWECSWNPQVTACTAKPKVCAPTSSKGPSAKPGTATPAETDAFMEAWRAAQCHLDAGCFTYLFESFEACMKVYPLGKEGSYMRWALEAGRVGLDPVGVGKCAASAAAGCAVTQTVSMDTCAQLALVPRVETGQPCLFGIECMSGECSKTADGCGVCVPSSGLCSLAQAEKYCGAGQRCLAPSAVPGSWWCGAPVPIGQSCNASTDCQDGISCVQTGSGGQAVAAMCGHGKAGDPCSSDDFCPIGLLCAANGTCSLPAKAGELCSEGVDCASGLACVGDEGKAACGQPMAGDPCPNNRNCGNALVCSGTVCRQPKKIGDTCTDIWDCPNWQATCDTKCVPRPGLGQACDPVKVCALPFGCDQKTKLCVVAGTEGHACRDIGNHLKCDGILNCDNGTRTCVKPTSEGQPCGPGKVGCDIWLTCDAGKCRKCGS